VPGDALGEAALARARAGEEDAFRELTDPHRRELQLHCYRILGSLQDAEDMVQETLLAAWRRLEAFEGRASVRAWLYRIATNRCLDALRARSRRPREVRAMNDPPEPTRRTDPIWLEPYPDVLLDDLPDRSPGPAARYEAREAVELAFIVALQGLPPRQRAALVLRDVLGFRTAEVAEMLDTGEGSVKGALQRARATLEARLPAADRDRAPVPNSARERQLVGRFADAFASGDVAEVVALLTDDALLTMPPQPLEYQGHEAIAAYLSYRAELRGTLLVVPTRANTQPALGCYMPDAQAAIARPYSLIVLTLEGDRIAAITRFAADTALFGHFGLPPTLRS
jgi:RNA polymerase sigma-70 factor (TIGR02960 family)